jgi:hypothetical protein
MVFIVCLKFLPVPKVFSGGCMNEKEAPLYRIIKSTISNIATSIVILYIIAISETENGWPATTGTNATWIE